MCRQGLLLGLLLAVLGIALSADAQWPQSADTNLVICNHTSEQVLPKIAATSDGGCYISWFDLASGNYDVYLQRLDGNGVEQFPHNGRLISNHTQDTGLADWDMAVDGQDHAILAFWDLRAGGDWDIYAYRISPNGDFDWGPNGIAISDNANFEPDPRVCVTSGGNIVIAWQEEVSVSPSISVINLRKLSPAGQDVWSPAIITLTSTYGLSIPRVAPAENDGVILQYLVHQGTQYWSPKYIYAQKFDSVGYQSWGPGALVSNAGGLGPQMKPNIISDGAGGIYSYWYDGRVVNQLHVYAQHVLANSGIQWETNGVQVSQSNTELQTDPAATVAPGTGHLMLFYMTMNLGQTQWGVGGQALNAAGQRQWGAYGITFAALSNQQRFMVNAGPQAGGAAVAYLEFISGSAVNNLVKAFRVDSAGAFVWPNSPRTLSSVVSEKGRLVGTVNNVGQFITAWSDQRNDGGDIYLQNVNPDGTLGPMGNQPPSPFSLIAPADNDTSDNQNVVFSWQASHDPDSGQVVTYILHVYSVFPIHAEVIGGIADTTYILTWYEIIGQPEHDWVTVEWWVEAVSGGDTTHSTETWHFVIPTEGAAGDPSANMPTRFALHPAYPNPFNPLTRIAFDLPKASFVMLKVYNVAGQEVATLVSSDMPVGHHSIAFDAARLPSGLYFCELEASGFRAVSKMILMK